MGWLRKQYERRLGKVKEAPHFTAEVEGETAVLHPIDLPTDITYESAEEREWRVERNTMLRKGLESGN